MERKQPTQAQVRRQCKECGCPARRIDGEWQVRIGDTHESTYFTNCGWDAVDTARMVYARRQCVLGISLTSY